MSSNATIILAFALLGALTACLKLVLALRVAKSNACRLQNTLDEVRVNFKGTPEGAMIELIEAETELN